MTLTSELTEEIMRAPLYLESAFVCEEGGVFPVGSGARGWRRVRTANGDSSTNRDGM